MSKAVLHIWDREFELNVVYECYPGEEVKDNQRSAFENICGTEAFATSLDAVKAYVQKTATTQIESTIDNIFKYVIPKSIYVPQSKKTEIVAIMCNYKFDTEHGMAVVFEDGKLKEVGSRDVVL